MVKDSKISNIIRAGLTDDLRQPEMGPDIKINCYFLYRLVPVVVRWQSCRVVGQHLISGTQTTFGFGNVYNFSNILCAHMPMTTPKPAADPVLASAQHSFRQTLLFPDIFEPFDVKEFSLYYLNLCSTANLQRVWICFAVNYFFTC